MKKIEFKRVDNFQGYENEAWGYVAKHLLHGLWNARPWYMDTFFQTILDATPEEEYSGNSLAEIWMASNGAVYSVIGGQEGKVFHVTSRNGWTGTMSIQALSLAASICAQNALCWALYEAASNYTGKDKARILKASADAGKMQYKIRDAALSTPEAEAILSFID